MSRRKYRLRPPTGPGYKSGQVLEFSASDDAHPRPSTTPVELTPVGPPPAVHGLKPEDDRADAVKSPPPGELAPTGRPEPGEPPT